MTVATPRITVLMSVYNAEAYVSAAVESILGQSFGDYHFVIYDDASSDGSRDIIARYRDPRIELRVRTENRGLTCNLADGLVRAEGDYIARMDADDIALEGRLAAQVGHLDACPDIDVLGTNVIFFDENGEMVGMQPEHHDDIALELFFSFTMMHPTIMLRRRAMVAHGWNYDPRFVYSQDFDLWSRMLASHRFANLQTPFLRLREHPEKVSRSKRDTQQGFTEQIRRRQLARLCPDISAEDCAVFCRAASEDEVQGRESFATLHRLLLRLIEANRHSGFYPSGPFDARAAAFFRETCRRALMRGHASGVAYWGSRLRRYERVSARQSAGMLWRTTRAIVAPTR